MPVTKLSLPGKSLHQRFSVLYVTPSNWNWDVYKNGPQPQFAGPYYPLMGPYYSRGHQAHLCLQIFSSR